MKYPVWHSKTFRPQTKQALLCDVNGCCSARLIHERSSEPNQANKIPTAAVSFFWKKIILPLSYIWFVLRACSFCFLAGSTNYDPASQQLSFFGKKYFRNFSFLESYKIILTTYNLWNKLQRITYTYDFNIYLQCNLLRDKIIPQLLHITCGTNFNI
jgi:hypothetical protein